MRKRIKIATILLVGLIALGCISCGGTQKHRHQWDINIVKEVTCYQQGLQYLTCKTCGEERTLNVAVLEHSIRKIDAKAPTCTDFGWEEYELCTRENCYYTTRKELKATGHKFVEDSEICIVEGCNAQKPSQDHDHDYTSAVTTPATCTKDGVRTYTCICGNSYTESIEKLKHDIAQYEAQTASCTQVGWEAYEACKRVGCDYTTYLEIPKLAHNYINNVCDKCGKINGANSEGLEFALVDNSYYELVGRGTCTDTAIIIPEWYSNLPVKSIGSVAFAECTDVTNIKIPETITEIATDAFYMCTGLQSIDVDEKNTVYKAIDGDLYTKDGLKFIQYALGKTKTAITLPETVTAIEGDAFYYALNLTSITIPDKVTSIGAWAFAETGYYQNEENWQDGVLYIGKHLIEADRSVPTEYVVKDGTLCIADGAFYNRTNVTKITLANTVTHIGEYAFENCKKLTSIQLGTALLEIKTLAFNKCSALTNVQIPATVMAIGDEAFKHCAALTSILVDGNNATYKEIDGNLYSKDGKTLIQYAIGKTDTSFVIPDTVESIGHSAFAYCLALEKVEISSTVRSIDFYAFYGCQNLSEVVFVNPEGWSAKNYQVSEVNFSKSSISNAASAAQLLTTSYYNYIWERI